MPPIETPPVITPPVVTPPVTPPAVPPVVTPPDPAAQAAADAAAAAAAANTPPVVTPPVVPPAEVTYALTLPKDAVIEASAVERLTAFAKDHKLSPEAAQKALDHTNAEVAADRTRQTAASTESFKKLAFDTWPAEMKADPVFGGEKFLTTVAEVKRAADRFLTDEERVVLNQTGWGNHPMLTRMFARIGQAMANDKFVSGQAGGSVAPKSDAAVIYPNMNP